MHLDVSITEDYYKKEFLQMAKSFLIKKIMYISIGFILNKEIEIEVINKLKIIIKFTGDQIDFFIDCQNGRMSMVAVLGLIIFIYLLPGSLRKQIGYLYQIVKSSYTCLINATSKKCII